MILNLRTTLGLTRHFVSPSSFKFKERESIPLTSIRFADMETGVVAEGEPESTQGSKVEDMEPHRGHTDPGTSKLEEPRMDKETGTNVSLVFKIRNGRVSLTSDTGLPPG